MGGYSTYLKRPRFNKIIHISMCTYIWCVFFAKGVFCLRAPSCNYLGAHYMHSLLRADMHAHLPPLFPSLPPPSLCLLHCLSISLNPLLAFISFSLSLALSRCVCVFLRMSPVALRWSAHLFACIYATRACFFAQGPGVGRGRELCCHGACNLLELQTL